MKLKTFTAPTYAEALKIVKEEVGEDAVIVSTKEIKKKTLTSKGLYEIVVAIEDNVEIKEKSPKKDINKIQDDNEDDVILKLSSITKEIDNITKEDNQQKSNIDTIKAKLSSDSNIDNLEIKELKEQVNSIADTLKLLQTTLWDISNKESLEIPPEFSEIYALSKASGMDPKHLDEIMKLTIKYMPVKMRKNSETIKRYFYTLLKKMIPIRLEKPTASQIMMFIGPTGVGKTTTIAKLAARYAYRLSKKYKVGMITLDTYRIGAVDQLMTYAKMMKLPIEVVVDPSDFSEAINSLKNNDYILIDTLGSSQHDKAKIDKLYNFIESSNYDNVSINLVLSATTKYEDLLDTYKSFSIFDIDTLIFTKLDETRNYGNIFSLLLEVEKPVSYLSIGQEVPDDIIQASSEYILKGILEKEFN